MSKKDLVQKALVGAKLSLCTLSGTVNLEGIITPIHITMREDSIEISAGEVDCAHIGCFFRAIFGINITKKSLKVTAVLVKKLNATSLQLTKTVTLKRLDCYEEPVYEADCNAEDFQSVIEKIFPIILKQYDFRQSKYSIVNLVTL